MKIIAGALGGLVAGAGCGWLLTLVVASVLAPTPQGFDGFAVVALQVIGVSIGATVGFITGGALSARHVGQPPRS